MTLRRDNNLKMICCIILNLLQDNKNFSARVRVFKLEEKTEGRNVEIKCQLDATEVFIADLIACSTCFEHHYAHHQELKSIIQWLLRVVFCAVVFQVAGLVWS